MDGTPEGLAELAAEASILLLPGLFETGVPETTLTRLAAAGVRVIVATGFDTRFYDKCVGHGLLPAILDEEAIGELATRAAARPDLPTTVDLEKVVIEQPGMEPLPFGVDPRARNKLLLGLTDLEEALRYLPNGAALREEDRKRRPWLYEEPGG